MMDKNKGLLLGIVFVIFVVCFTFYISVKADADRTAYFHGRTYDLERQLRSEGLYENSWILGELRSPVFLVTLHSDADFIGKVKELKPNNVFIDDGFYGITRSYYVFTEDFSVGYSYTIRR